jgi:hypothetical protein
MRGIEYSYDTGIIFEDFYDTPEEQNIYEKLGRVFDSLFYMEINNKWGSPTRLDEPFWNDGSTSIFPFKLHRFSLARQFPPGSYRGSKEPLSQYAPKLRRPSPLFPLFNPGANGPWPSIILDRLENNADMPNLKDLRELYLGATKSLVLIPADSDRLQLQEQRLGKNSD